MPQTSPIEHHFTSGEAVRDVGIACPMGTLAASLFGTLQIQSLIVVGGVAEVVEAR